MSKDFVALRNRVSLFDPAEISKRNLGEKQADKEAFLAAMEALGEKEFSSRNPVGHFTVSILLVNDEGTDAFVNFHKVDQSYTWFGGHGDGTYDPEDQIIREVGEECGFTPDKFEILDNSGHFVSAQKFLDDPELCAKIMAVSAFGIKHHIKRGKNVPNHTHYDVAFLGRTSRNNVGTVKFDENEFVGWMSMKELNFAMADREKFIIFKDFISYMKKYVM